MADGIFDSTMVNMEWPEIQDAAEDDALVLFPLGVIEEHGPHLCLGTDIYTAHIHCVYIKKEIEKHNVPVIIAPPFYWGICQSTGDFTGSFRIKKSTAKALLVDIVTSLADFGFSRIYGINAHGDIEHSVAIIEAFKEITEEIDVHASYTFGQERLHHFGLSGEEKYICPIRQQSVQVSRATYPDVHAGDIETATMTQFYPQLTDVEKAGSLPPVKLDDDMAMKWLGGGYTKQVSPEGYIGAPADFNGVDVSGNIHDIAQRIAEAILEKEYKRNNDLQDE